MIKQAATPIDWSPAKRRQKDVDATWSKKHGKSYFGYKLSVCADKRYKPIRKIKISTASEQTPVIWKMCWMPATPAAISMATKVT